MEIISASFFCVNIKESGVCALCINRYWKIENNIQKCKKLLKENYKYDNVKNIKKENNFQKGGGMNLYSFESVLGTITEKEMGHTQPHEHVYIVGTIDQIRCKEICINNFPASMEELKLYKEAGGSAVVDANPLATGRDALALKDLSRLTGVQILATTGYHIPNFIQKITGSGTLLLINSLIYLQKNWKQGCIRMEPGIGQNIRQIFVLV